MMLQRQFLVPRTFVIGVLMLALIGLVGVGMISAETVPTQPAATQNGADTRLTISPPFTPTYSTSELGTPDGLAVAGSVAIDPSRPNLLYFGANNFSGFDGQLYVVELMRNVTGTITGFTGTAQLVEAVPGVRSLQFMPNGTLLVGSEFVVGGGVRSAIYQYAAVTLGGGLPISADSVTQLDASQLGPFPAPATAFARVPLGLPDGGNVQLFDSREQQFNLNPSVTVSSTYDISATRGVDFGPFYAGQSVDIRGVAYVPDGSPIFTSTNTVLLAENGPDETLAAYALDGSRTPITSTRRVFVTSIGNDAFYGMSVDPLTGDLLVVGTGASASTTINLIQGFDLPEMLAVTVHQMDGTDAGHPLIVLLVVLFLTVLSAVGARLRFDDAPASRS